MLGEGFSSSSWSVISSEDPLPRPPQTGHIPRREPRGARGSESPQGPGQIWVGQGWGKATGPEGWPEPAGFHLHPHKLKAISRNSLGSPRSPIFFAWLKAFMFFKYPRALTHPHTHRSVICTRLHGVPIPSPCYFNPPLRHHVPLIQPWQQLWAAECLLCARHLNPGALSLELHPSSLFPPWPLSHPYCAPDKFLD